MGILYPLLLKKNNDDKKSHLFLCYCCACHSLFLDLVISNLKNSSFPSHTIVPCMVVGTRSYTHSPIERTGLRFDMGSDNMDPNYSCFRHQTNSCCQNYSCLPDSCYHSYSPTKVEYKSCKFGPYISEDKHTCMSFRSLGIVRHMSMDSGSMATNRTAADTMAGKTAGTKADTTERCSRICLRCFRIYNCILFRRSVAGRKCLHFDTDNSAHKALRTSHLGNSALDMS